METAARPNVVPLAQEKKYIPSLTLLHPEEDVIFLDRFCDSMAVTQIPNLQWVARLHDILKGKMLKTFQDLPGEDKCFFKTVKAELLASLSLPAETYQLHFLKATPICRP